MRETVYRTEELPAADRFEWWRELTARTLVPTVFDRVDASDFRAEARLLDLGAVGVSVLSYPAFRSRRTAPLVRRSDPELYQVALTRRGRQGLTQCRREALAEPGTLVLYDTSHPFDAVTLPERGAVEVVIVHLPRTALPLPSAQLDSLLAVPLPADEGVGALLSAYLTGLAGPAQTYRPQDTARLGSVTMDLVTTFLASCADAEEAVRPESRRRSLLMSVHSFVERHLGDPELSPAAVAAAHHISTRYLHRLFQQEGTTVAAWIRLRRLERCRSDLADPRLGGLPVGAVGARWGFRHAADFSRAFRAAYGMPPGAYRRSCTGGERPGPPAAPAP